MGYLADFEYSYLFVFVIHKKNRPYISSEINVLKYFAKMYLYI